MKEFLWKKSLLFVVFITGAAVLIIEITATRILSTYFGSTIYTVSSVISVILLALSLGYYIGGRLADKNGTPLIFYLIIACSGVNVFLLQLFKMFMAPSISQNFSIQDGPLVLSLLLFFAPAFLLGTLSPIVIKLQKQMLPKEGIGRIAGDVFFWSTLGSIIGSLATGFYLIPFFGVDQIIIGVASVLVGIGVIGMVANTKSTLLRVKILFFIPFFLALQAGFFFIQSTTTNPSIVYAKDGVYGSLVVYNGTYNDKPVRFFKQDTDASSAMYLESSGLVYDYTKYYQLYKGNKTTIAHALMIGAGAYSIPKELLALDKNVVVDVVDIEPLLLDIGKEYFNVPTSPRLRSHVADGRRFLYESDVKYDLIFGDAFQFSIPAHLTTKEFLQLTRANLNEDGVYIMNVIGSLTPESPSFLLSEIHTFKTVFPNSYYFAVRGLDVSHVQNIIMVGYKSDKKLDLEKVEKLDPFLSDLSTREITIDDLDYTSHPILTDNYAPVEYFISKSFD